MAYKVFDKGSRSIDETPYISIRANGNLYLNAAAMKKYFNGIRYVFLLYDKGGIAIRPLEKKEEKCYTLNFSSKKSKSTGVVSARGFLKFLFKGKPVSRKLKTSWNTKEKCLEAKI